MIEKIVKELRPKMEEKVRQFSEKIKMIRAGKAEGSLVENINVSYYGTNIPLKQTASIQTPQPNLIIISPWDKNMLGDIELAIRNSGLSLNPSNDGNVIRIVLPPLSQERREELSKLIHKEGEAVKIVLRNLRHDSWQKIVRAEREHQISEDERYAGEEKLNKIIDEFNEKIDQIVKNKEAEIMQV